MNANNIADVSDALSKLSITGDKESIKSLNIRGKVKSSIPRGPKYEQLQQALAAIDKTPTSATSAPSCSSAQHCSTAGTSLLMTRISEMSAYFPGLDVSSFLTEPYLFMQPTIAKPPGTSTASTSARAFGMIILVKGFPKNCRWFRCRHFNSILADGLVRANGKLRAGDELLEISGERLFDMNHVEVVAISKELPQDARKQINPTWYRANDIKSYAGLIQQKWYVVTGSYDQGQLLSGCGTTPVFCIAIGIISQNGMTWLAVF
uniref:PDZ domain-containing protein n=1 Tax=Glossina austeni TaxID=7395 RepID=A0A1A9UCR3_GLOAU